MNLGDLLDQAKAGDAKAAIKVSDHLRRQGLKYFEIAEFVLIKRGIEAAEWEALLLEGESEGE